MHQKNKDIQKRYEGFLQTNYLWKKKLIYELEQFEIEAKSQKIDIEINEKLRLGKYVERFVSHQLSQEDSISIISENIQIQREKITLGELDCIIKKGRKLFTWRLYISFICMTLLLVKVKLIILLGQTKMILWWIN